MNSQTFVCNICGGRSALGAIHRELAPCAHCGSNARFRALMLGLTTGLFGDVRTLAQLPVLKQISGIGCSDADLYAKVLDGLFDYQNTFLHAPPYADITDASTLQPYRDKHFIICSDVLEHVLAPPIVALKNLHECLAPDGVLVVSVPTFEMPHTIERYPTLKGYDVIEKSAGRFIVRYETALGRRGEDLEPVFHGGPGSTLEIRLFSHSDFIASLRHAGFVDIEEIRDPENQFGAFWPIQIERHDLPVLADGGVIIARRGDA